MRLNKIFFPIIILLLLTNQLSLEQTKYSLSNSPTKIAKWLKDNISQVKDKVSYAQTPQETFDRREGDCEDLSILAQYFIGDTYETYLVVWRGKFREDSEHYKEYKEKIYHCICVVKIHDAMWGCIDLGKYIYGRSTLVGIIEEDCDAREINIEKAYFVKRNKKGGIKVVEKIDLSDYWKVY